MIVLRLPAPASPEVSVILVTYGGGEWPLRALAALEANTDPVYEVVAVDNASPDGTADRLASRVEGLRLVRNDRNLGFAAAAHQGAGEARADLLCFLNPDALVTPGWLEALRAAAARAGIGAAVPRFLDATGRVQEAGSVVDRQGWTEALGAGLDPADASTRFPRVVDYGSAACLLIPRAAYERAGGFDPAYFPAYCEDVDLAFALRAAGLHTLYEPRADVVHQGAVSAGEAGRVELIERNRPRLLERWGEELDWRPPLGELDRHPHRVLALRDALVPERVLVLADRIPGPSDPLGRFLIELAEARPAVRFTLATAEEGDADRLLAAGVEVAAGADVAAWLEARRFHHSAVLADPPGWERWGDAVRRSQPQAARLCLGPGEVGADAWMSLGPEPAPANGRPSFSLAEPGPLLAWLGAAL